MASNNKVIIFCTNYIIKGSIIPELQNRVTHHDVTNRVTNSKVLFLSIFRVSS